MRGKTAYMCIHLISIYIHFITDVISVKIMAVFLVYSFMCKCLSSYCGFLARGNKLSEPLEKNLKEKLSGMRSRDCQSGFTNLAPGTIKAYPLDIGSLRRKNIGPIRGVGLVWLLKEGALMLNTSHVNFIDFNRIIWESVWHQDAAKEKCPYTTI